MTNTKPSHETEHAHTMNDTSDTNDQKAAPDPLAFSIAMSNIMARATPLFKQAMDNFDIEQAIDPLNIKDIAMEFWQGMMSNPEKIMQTSMTYMQNWQNLLHDTARRMHGHDLDLFEANQNESSDRRFSAPEWQENALFNFIKQSYLLTATTIMQMVNDTDNLDKTDREKLGFVVKLYADALSPSNFAMMNPDVMRETIDTNGENIIRGLENLIKDLERNQGEFRIATTDYDAFKVGENMAVTSGQVVYENDLMQLIQYDHTPDQKNVLKTPLLITPPWINKYYILDLRPGKSFVEWAVAQGHTVFMISWVNPDHRHADKTFDDYMSKGILDALDQIEVATGQHSVNAIGYCLGGTLLACTLSHLQKTRQAERIQSATFFTTLLDFEKSGELKLFMDDAMLDRMEQDMSAKGVFEGKHLNKTFALLRANDMIWSFVVNNYLLGKEPFSFDLLYWNDDSTNMPAAMHKFYLRKFYRDNCLTTANALELNGQGVDLSQVKTPCYFLSTRDDHIAPWMATFDGAHLMGGEVTFTLAASGHIAGVVNSPEKNKYCYWTEDFKSTEGETWLGTAQRHEGSWWTHWHKWTQSKNSETVPAREVSKGIEPAPGRYVHVKA